jgi:hypothetical protein
MATTHDIGKYYWHVMVYPIKPPVVFEKAETQEIEEPYRNGKGYCFRFPFTRLSLVVGKWVRTYPESEALTVAINGRKMNEEEINWDYIRNGADYDV